MYVERKNFWNIFWAKLIVSSSVRIGGVRVKRKSYEIRLNVKEKKPFPFRTKLRTDLKFKLYPNNEILGNS